MSAITAGKRTAAVATVPVLALAQHLGRATAAHLLWRRVRAMLASMKLRPVSAWTVFAGMC